MTGFLAIVVYTAAAGACIPLGGALASIARIHPRWLEKEFRHFVIALGGGVLLAAVVFVLLPSGMKFVGEPVAVLFWFLLGGGAFFLLERAMGLKRRESPQFLAMLLDYVPESLALGGIVASGGAEATLLAMLIGLQNVPEGFNAYRELAASRRFSRGEVLARMLLLVPVGPVLGVLGGWFLSSRTDVLGAVMLFSAGGILYLIFQDIAPQSRLDRHWFPPLGAVCGVAVGLFGHLLISVQ
jgi:ZIP family zinc transporter